MFRKLRYVYWVTRELIKQYTRSLGLGLLLGLAVAFIFWKLTPVVQSRWFLPIKRIGVVGEFTPSTLPLTIQRQISRGLTNVNTEGEAIPDIALSWEATDSGKLYIFRLRDDAKWQNGKSFVATDVNYNIKNVSFFYTDALLLKVALQNAYSPLPTLLAKPIFGSGLTGLGTYKVLSVQLKGNSVRYMKLTPQKDKDLPILEYRFYRTETQGILGFQMGEIDELDEIMNPFSIQSTNHVVITEKPMLNRIVTVFFNLNDPLLQDKSFRQALGYALPEFPYERAFSPLSKTSWAYTDKVKHYGNDPEEARQMLSQFLEATSSATLMITTFPQYVDTAQAIAKNWSSLGIPTEVKVENSLSSSYQILVSAQDIPPDPDQYPFWHSTQTVSNITHYANVKIDKLLEDGRQESDKEQRGKIYADFQRRLVDDAPAFFLYYPTLYTIARNP